MSKARRNRKRSFSIVGRLDERFEHVERECPNAIADRELVAARKLLETRRQPDNEAVVCLQRGPGSPGIVRYD